MREVYFIEPDGRVIGIVEEPNDDLTDTETIRGYVRFDSDDDLVHDGYLVSHAVVMRPNSQDGSTGEYTKYKIRGEVTRSVKIRI